MTTYQAAVPCGIHTIIPDTKGQSIACGGTCTVEHVGDELVYYRCQRCGFPTSRYLDGRPIPAWDGLLRDGTPYEGSGVDENDWRL